MIQLSSPQVVIPLVLPNLGLFRFACALICARAKLGRKSVREGVVRACSAPTEVCRRVVDVEEWLLRRLGGGEGRQRGQGRRRRRRARMSEEAVGEDDDGKDTTRRWTTTAGGACGGGGSRALMWSTCY
jgi:hypothetical protein